MTDLELTQLFNVNPVTAWELFLDRYADVMLSYLRRWGHDYDQVMDRFVYICEKLCESDFRRLREIRYVGNNGYLKSWLFKVMKNLVVNQAVSVQGRERLPGPINHMSEKAKLIFRLYFFKDYTPSEIYQVLSVNYRLNVTLMDVLDSIALIFSNLTEKSLWQLISRWFKKRPSLAGNNGGRHEIPLEAVAVQANPETELLRKENQQILSQALNRLTASERLIVQLRYEEGLKLKEIAERLHTSERNVRRRIKAILEQLQKALN